MSFTPENKALALARIKEGCIKAIELFDTGDYGTFWLVAGMIAGGLEKCETLPEISSGIMRTARSENKDIPEILKRGTVALLLQEAIDRL